MCTTPFCGLGGYDVTSFLVPCSFEGMIEFLSGHMFPGGWWYIPGSMALPPGGQTNMCKNITFHQL